jgi:hypothetical protein
MPNYHFEDDQVIADIANTDYAKREISRHLHAMTCDQKWSVYRAVVKLAAEQDAKQNKPGRTLFSCQKCGDLVGDGEQDHNNRHPNCGGALDPMGEVPED